MLLRIFGMTGCNTEPATAWIGSRLQRQDCNDLLALGVPVPVVDRRALLGRLVKASAEGRLLLALPGCRPRPWDGRPAPGAPTAVP